MTIVNVKTEETSTPLAANAQYTGKIHVMDFVKYFKVFIISDKAGTLYVKHSDDKNTWYDADKSPFSYDSTWVNIGINLAWRPFKKYMRVIYLNGTVAQTSFKLTVMLEVDLP